MVNVALVGAYSIPMGANVSLKEFGLPRMLKKISIKLDILRGGNQYKAQVQLTGKVGCKN